MLNYKPNFQFIGFEADQDVKNFITSVANRLHSLAPSDAIMNFTIKKGKDAIAASCKIASKAGVFADEIVAASPWSAIQELESQMMRQLEEWKKKRFSDMWSATGGGDNLAI